ncbi:MAG: hypothetical protein AMXMBFR58_17210 [Phycisphaerae bacterium]
MLATAAGLASPAAATWSIVICDTRTGEVAVASATCLTGFDLQANTPVLIVGVGGATAQSFVDSTGTNRTFIRDGMYAGVSPADILAGLSVFDSSHQTKQYGMADVLGRTVTFSGTGAGAWKGGTTGVLGDLVYAVQGNVLWGPLVVDKAVEAIINTPGDIPAKLMASMEAARAWGGDGRCSCSNGDPDGCTTLPDEFKSAHIAYMLIGRAGDRDGSNGNYKFAGFSTACEPGDFNQDGRPDVVACGGSGIGVFPNVTPPGQPPQLGTVIPQAVGYSPRELAVADFNADGLLDVAVTNNGGDHAATLMGNGDGTFDAPTNYAAGDGPVGISAGDLNGDTRPDIAIANATSDSVTILLNTGAGGMSAGPVIAAKDSPNTATLADVDADGDLDLLVSSTTAKTLEIFRNNGSASFASAALFTYTQAPVAVDVADISGDGRPDLAVSTSNESLVKIHVQNPDGTFGTSTISAGGTAGSVYFRDLDHDGRQDMFLLQRGGSRVYFFKGNGDGTFQAGKWYPIGFGPLSMRLADMDSDGDLDPVIRLGGSITCLMTQVGDGVFNSMSGLAGGDYFMSFNIANQSVGQPDPVFQLQDLFDAWRADLVGKPDAVQSVASFLPPVIHADGEDSTVLTVRARDWQSTDVSLAGAQVSVQIYGDPVAQVGDVTINADGTASVPVTALQSCGTAVFEVTINGLGRKVVLMPRVALTVSDPADFDRSGFVDTNDYDAFVAAFTAGTDDADFDKTGFVDTDDFTAFVLQFENPC